MSEYIYTTEGTFGLRECTGEEIVRCRDCKFARVTEHGLLDCSGPLTTIWDYWNDDFKENPVEPDGFCAWAERREP